MRTFSNQCHDFLRSVKVTNDVAERDIVMTEAFMHTVKDDEAQVVVVARGEGAPVESLKFDNRSLATL